MELKPVWIDARLQETVKVAAAMQKISMRRLSEEALRRHLAADERTEALVPPLEEEPTPCPSQP